MKLLSGNALVTGGGSGIGRQLCIAYIRAGCQNVTMGDLNAAGMKKTAELIKAEFPDAGILQVKLDVTDEDSVNDLVTQAVEAFGTLDYAANAAGVIVNERAKTADYPIKEWDRVMAINARGVALCMSAEAKVMVKQKRKVTSEYWKDDRRAQVGSIINFASVCGFVAMPNVSPYQASKHAVLGMTRSAAIEHASDGLRINAVCPGIVDTPFLDGIRKTGVDESHPAFANPMGRLCYPDEIADACIFLSSTMSSYVNGHGLVSDGSKTAQY